MSFSYKISKAKLCALWFTIFSITSLNVVAQEQRSPNLIFIMADDLGIGDLGCYGQEFIRTPAIDKLSREGIRFTQHYAGAPVCAPSRCVLMTGKSTGIADIRGNGTTKEIDGEHFDLPMAADEITVAEIMQQNNYTTGCVGKWGLGGPYSEGDPNQAGFDYFFGYLDQVYAHRHYPLFLYENAKKIMLNKQVYSHDIMEEKALDFIKRNSEEPFFLYFCPTIPHADLKVPNDDIGIYEGMFNEVAFPGHPPGIGYLPVEKPIGTYAAMVSRLDKSVSLIMDLLKEINVDRNTIVIFTSDNGVHNQAGYDPEVLNSNGPFRGIKRDLYEGGIRTPYVVRWPDEITPSSVCHHISTFWDFLPTVCDLIGVEVPEESDGISFLPSLLGTEKQEKHDFLYWEIHELGGKQAVLQNQWKLIRFDVDKQNYRYELYNLEIDPAESRDLALHYPEIVRRMIGYIDAKHVKNERYPFKYETDNIR